MIGANLEMKGKRLLVTAFVCAAACKGSAPTPIAEPRVESVASPAATQLAAWITAFNSGDRATLLAYHQRAFAYEVASHDVRDIDRELGLSKGTGGFELKKSETPASTSVVAIVKERHSEQFAQVKMEVDAGDRADLIGQRSEAFENLGVVNVVGEQRDDADFLVAEALEDVGIQPLRRIVRHHERLHGAVEAQARDARDREHAHGDHGREHRPWSTCDRGEESVHPRLLPCRLAASFVPRATPRASQLEFRRNLLVRVDLDRTVEKPL